jgi:uncharacterized protein
MRDYALPSRDECYELIRQCHVPVHIVKHSKAAARLGVFLARRLVAAGIDVDVDLVERACLLHDIFRVCEFPLEDFRQFEQPVTEEDKAKWRRLKGQHSGVRHEDAACAFLTDAYPVLAQTIRKHRYTAIVHEEDRPETWEEKLVYYADKRVMHDSIVPLQKRLDEAHQRNAARRKAAGPDGPDTAKIDAAVFALEAEIFRPLGLNPQSITAELIEAQTAAR